MRAVPVTTSVSRSNGAAKGDPARALDVRGLQVAVNDPLLVRGLERIGNLPPDRQRFTDRNRALRDSLRERVAFNQFEHQRAPAVHRLDAVDRADVRVVERRQHARFALEAHHAVAVVHKRGRQHFDGNVAAERGVAGPVDFTHAAGTKARSDFERANATADQVPRSDGQHAQPAAQKSAGGCGVRKQRLHFPPREHRVRVRRPRQPIR